MALGCKERRNGSTRFCHKHANMTAAGMERDNYLTPDVNKILWFYWNGFRQRRKYV